MNPGRQTTIAAKFLNDVVAEVDRAREKFPSNRHIMGAMHEEVGEVAKAMLERDYKATDMPVSSHNFGLDMEVYVECIQAAAMLLRVATEGDPDYLYQNPHYREMDVDDDPAPVDPNHGTLDLDINEVQVQVDSNQRGVRLTHQPTGCVIICEKHATQWENQAAALKELDEEVKKHLSWGPQDDHLVIPAHLRRGDSDG